MRSTERKRQMTAAVIALFYCLSIPPIMGQSAIEPIVPIASTRNGLEAWSMGGAYVASWRDLVAPIHNPASSGSGGLSVYSEFGRVASSDVTFANLDGAFLLPSYLSFSMGIDKLNLSLGYSNSYNFLLDIDQGSINELRFQTAIRTFFGSLSYSIPNRIAIGATLGLNHLDDHFEVKGGQIQAEGAGTGFELRVGALYSLFKRVTLGASFDYAGDINYNIDETHTGIGSNYGETVDGKRKVILFRPPQVTVKAPWSFQAGFSLDLSSFVSLNTMVDYQRWSSAFSSLDDKVQIHAGAHFLSASGFSFALGFFYPQKHNLWYGFESKILEYGHSVALVKKSGALRNGTRQSSFVKPKTKTNLLRHWVELFALKKPREYG